jgi:ABC-type oligopeptide transport system substrate-binding subunit
VLHVKLGRSFNEVFFATCLFAGIAFGVLALAAPVGYAATPKNQLVIGTSLAQVLSLDPQQATEAKAARDHGQSYDRLVSTDVDGKSFRSWPKAGISTTRASPSSCARQSSLPEIR